MPHLLNRDASSTRRLTVGVSLFARDGQAIWENGIHQNIAFLVMMLSKSERIGRIYLLNGGDARAVAPGLDFMDIDAQLVNPRDVQHELDVIIEMGAQLPRDWLRYMRALGKKIVTFFVGNTYAGVCELPIFNRPSSHIFNGSPVDEVWLLPQYEKTAGAMLQTLLRAPVYLMPHVWSPHFVDRRNRQLADNGLQFGYKPGRRTWRLAVLEPNISVAKTCHYPMLVAEEFHRANPDAVEHLSVLNTEHMRQHPSFVCFANSLDLIKQHKATFDARSDLPAFLTQHADAVISHQWENAQNYLYYDVLYGGYPLIHNSEMLWDAGYYYPEFDAVAGGKALLEAWRNHDQQLDDYKRRSNAALQRVSIDNPDNLKSFLDRLSA